MEKAGKVLSLMTETFSLGSIFTDMLIKMLTPLSFNLIMINGNGFQQIYFEATVFLNFFYSYKITKIISG